MHILIMVLQYYRINDITIGFAYGAALVPLLFGTAVLWYYRNTAQAYCLPPLMWRDGREAEQNFEGNAAKAHLLTLITHSFMALK